jgi:hypothetical protein
MGVFIDNIGAEGWYLELLCGILKEIKAKAEFKVAEIERRIGHQRHGFHGSFTLQARLHAGIAKNIAGIQQQNIFF